EQALLEGGGVEAGQDAAEGVLRGDALGQVEVTGEPGATVEGELVDGGDRGGSGGDAAGGDGEGVEQGGLAGALDAGILEILEVVVKGGRSDVGHALLLGEDGRILGESLRPTVQKIVILAY